MYKVGLVLFLNKGVIDVLAPSIVQKVVANIFTCKGFWLTSIIVVLDYSLAINHFCVHTVGGKNTKSGAGGEKSET